MIQARTRWIGALGFLALNVAVRLPSLHQPIDRDLAAYATIGQQIGRGLVPYSDVFDHKQPLVYPVYWLLTTISSHSTEVIRIAASIVAGIAVSALFLFLSRRAHWSIAAATAIFATFAGASRYVEGVDLNTEHLLVLTGSLAILLSLSLAGGTRRAIPLLVGGAIGIAILTKASGALLAPAALIPLIWGRKFQDRSMWRRIALFGTGMAIPIALTAGVFGLLGAWQEFFHANITYNRVYVASTPHESLASWFDQPVIFQILATAGVVAIFGRMLIAKKLDPVGVTCLLWLLGAFIGAELSNRGFPHYFAPLVIPTAMCLCLPFWNARDLRPTVAGTAVLLLATAPFAIDVSRTLHQTPDSLAVRMYGAQATVWALQDEAGLFLRKRALPGDRLMVAESEPGFYWASGIRPASRYIYDYPWQFEPGFMTQVAADLDPPPRFMVLPRGSLPPYMEPLSEHPYELIHSIGSVQIFELPQPAGG